MTLASVKFCPVKLRVLYNDTEYSYYSILIGKFNASLGIRNCAVLITNIRTTLVRSSYSYPCIPYAVQPQILGSYRGRPPMTANDMIYILHLANMLLLSPSLPAALPYFRLQTQ
jgi:hypothetical protein